MTKLCPRGKAAAKRKFKVYPSAYANAYASKICAGKIKDPSGTKRKDWGPKKAKVGMAVTAGAQSGMGRLQKSGFDSMKGNKKAFEKTLKGAKDFVSAERRDKAKVKKMMSGGFGIFSKKKKEEEKKSVQEENATKKKKRLEELRKEIGAKKGKMMIMIAIGKPKKANEGVFVKKPIMPANARIKTKRINPAKIEYQRKLEEYRKFTDTDKKLKTKKRSQGGDIIKKVASKLEKASKAHAGQAKTLRSIKVRGGGMAVQGINFKGVY